MAFYQYKLGHHLPCLMGPEFHASDASSSEEYLNIFMCISMIQIQDSPRRIHIGPWGHYLNKAEAIYS